MGSFGWAYIDCASSSHETGSAGGPTGSVQCYDKNGDSEGHANFVYVHSAKTLHLTGALNISGAISASSYHIKNVVNMDVSGSTYFGNTNDDVHIRTGSFSVGRAGSGNTVLKADQATLTTKVGSFAAAYKKVTGASYTIALGDYVIACSGNVTQTLTLPTAASVLAGTHLLIKDEFKDRAAANKIHISASGGNKLENKGFTVLAGTMPAINLYTDGSNWFIY